MSGNCLRDSITKFVLNKFFDAFIMGCIIANTIVLGVAWYGMADEVQNVIEIINYAFMAIFTLEAILKLIALRCHYFRDSWNVFDFVVVVGTLIVLVV